LPGRSTSSCCNIDAVDSLWVLILLLVIGSTIVTVRLFLNGGREDAATLEGFAPAESTAGAPSARSRRRAATAAAPATAPAATAAEAAATPARARSSRRAASRSASPAQPAVWPGGDCPNCGSPTVPSAKFCGECGHRLTA